jgi:TonB family protein
MFGVGTRWLNSLRKIVCAVIWFQPLAWYAARRAAETRERACDDLVLNSGIAPTEYATHLVEIARGSHLTTAAGIGMVRSSMLEDRLQAILGRSVCRAAVTRRFRMALVLSTAALLSGMALLRADDQKVYPADDPGIKAPKLTAKVEPQYTPEARDAGVTGDVVVSLEIDKEGRTQNIKVVAALEPGLDKNAVAAVREWRFDPATREGVAVVCAAKAKITFRLQ